MWTYKVTVKSTTIVFQQSKSLGQKDRFFNKFVLLLSPLSFHTSSPLSQGGRAEAEAFSIPYLDLQCFRVLIIPAGFINLTTKSKSQ